MWPMEPNQQRTQRAANERGLPNNFNLLRYGTVPDALARLIRAQIVSKAFRKRDQLRGWEGKAVNVRGHLEQRGR